MKATFVSALLFGAAMAAPAQVNEKRSIVVSEVIVTEWTTTTVYADASATKSAAAFFEFPASWSSVLASQSASSSAPPAPTSSVAVAAPTTPPAAPAAAPSVAAPAPAPAPAPAAAPAAGGGPSGTGDITFYSLGLTSCGQTYSDSDAVVALSHLVMNNGANSNNNPLCGKTITITYNGITKTGKVVDTCEGCAAGNIDLSPSLFQAFAPESAGRVPGVSWSVSS